ncbi:MAG TPA: hypothetical protein VKG25_12595 [Bryobacteraceae bacterium]|nr:hypothetical protein [Bryobacteraceae bacterium]
MSAALSASVSGVQPASSHTGSHNTAGTLTAVMEPEVMAPEVVAPEVVEPPAAEPEPRPCLEQDLKQVRQHLGDRILRVQKQYAQNFLKTQRPSSGKCEPEPESWPAVMNGMLKAQQKIAEAMLRAEAEEHWDARLTESAAAQLTPVIDIWEAAQRVHAEEMWRARIEEEARRQRERRLRELEGALSSATPEFINEPVRPPTQHTQPRTQQTQPRTQQAQPRTQQAQPRESAWEREVARQREATAAAVAEDAALAMRVYAREMLEAQAEAAVQQAHERAIGAIAETFQKQPASSLLAAPREVLFVPVRIAGHRNMGLAQFESYPPQEASKPAAILDFPLAKPLPVKAQSRVQTEKPEAVVEPKRVFPSWVLSAVAVAATILVVVNFFRTGNAPTEAKAPVEASTVSDIKPSPTAGNSPTPASNTTTATTPFARDVEVSGLRIGVDLLHRSQLQYLVINHSGVQLTGVALHIKVTSTAPANKGVLFQVSAVVPSLGPNESKEIRTDIEGQLQSKPIPDWQYLKTEVQISGQ